LNPTPSGLSLSQGIGDESLTVEVVDGVEGFVAGFFLGGDGGIEFAGGDFFGGGVDEAEFAGGEVVFGGANGRAKGAAEDGAVFVEVAGALVQVEDGTGFIVGELFEEDGGLVVFVEGAGGAVAGEPGVEAGEGVGDASAYALSLGWVGLFECGEAFAEAGCVFVGYGEDPDAALGATRFADEVVAATPVGVGNCGVYDLDKGRHG